MDFDSSQQGIESVCKEIYRAEGIHCSGKRLLVDVRVAKIPSGHGSSDVSLIDEPSWKELREPTLEVTTDRLRSASGHLMKFKGTSFYRSLIHSLRTQDCQRSLIFVKHVRGSDLLGMNWIRKTGLFDACIAFLRSLNNQIRGTVFLSEGKPTRLQEVLSQFADAFRTDLGHCSISVGFRLRPDAELKVFPPRRQPIHLRKKIDAELSNEAFWNMSAPQFVLFPR